MTRNYKIGLTAICLAAAVIIIFTDYYALRIDGYRKGFPKIELGQTKETVINLMGKPVATRRCDFAVYDSDRVLMGECFEVFTFQGIWDQWEVAFDKNENVVEKYYFLGEYGNRPPDIK